MFSLSRWKEWMNRSADYLIASRIPPGHLVALRVVSCVLCLVLSCLSCLVLSSFVMSCLVVSCLVLSCPVLSWLVLSGLVLVSSRPVFCCVRSPWATILQPQRDYVGPLGVPLGSLGASWGALSGEIGPRRRPEVRRAKVTRPFWEESGHPGEHFETILRSRGRF